MRIQNSAVGNIVQQTLLPTVCNSQHRR